MREHYLSAVAVYDDDLSSARYNHTEQIKLIMELKETLTTEIEFRKTVRRELMEATRYTKQLQTSSVELLNEKEKLEQVVSNLLDTESQDMSMKLRLLLCVEPCILRGALLILVRHYYSRSIHVIF